MGLKSISGKITITYWNNDMKKVDHVVKNGTDVQNDLKYFKKEKCKCIACRRRLQKCSFPNSMCPIIFSL